MSTDLDGAPIYDQLVNKQTNCLSDSYMIWLNTFIQTLQEYLSSTGIFIPQLTQIQINSISTPIIGQMVYNVDQFAPQIWQEDISGNLSWKTFTLT